MDVLTFELNGEQYKMINGVITKIEKRSNRTEWEKLKVEKQNEDSQEESYQIMLNGHY